MKAITTTIFSNCGRGVRVVAAFAFATVGPASAETITKPFEIGVGTALTHSTSAFYVPCSFRSVGAAVQADFQSHSAARLLVGNMNEIAIVRRKV